VSDLGRPELGGAVRRPAPALRLHIDRYVGYHQVLGVPGIHRGLPSQHLTLIVAFDEPVDIVAMPNPAQPSQAFFALVGGLHAAPAMIRHNGRHHGIQLELTALGARRLLGMPAGELGSTVLALDEVLGRPARELSERLAASLGWAARFDVLDEVLTRALVDRAGPPAEVAWVWERLVATGGGVEVGALAGEVGWSRRHLGERFRQELGLSPKVAARVLRFERACELLRRPRRPGLADVAARCGYTDQAHLTREWHDLAGCSPTTWMAEELPFVQDSAQLENAG
jgi:AraC-like DNA-binding protein